MCEALIPLDVIDPREPNTLPLFINTPGYGFKRGLRYITSVYAVYSTQNRTFIVNAADKPFIIRNTSVSGARSHHNISILCINLQIWTKTIKVRPSGLQICGYSLCAHDHIMGQYDTIRHRCVSLGTKSIAFIIYMHLLSHLKTPNLKTIHPTIQKITLNGSAQCYL